MSSLTSRGTPDETCHPYISGRTGDDQSAGAACADLSERTFKIVDYRSVSSSQVKAALQDGPVSTTMSVYEDFMY